MYIKSIVIKNSFVIIIFFWHHDVSSSKKSGNDNNQLPDMIFLLLPHVNSNLIIQK